MCTRRQWRHCAYCWIIWTSCCERVRDVRPMRIIHIGRLRFYRPVDRLIANFCYYLLSPPPPNSRQWLFPLLLPYSYTNIRFIPILLRSKLLLPKTDAVFPLRSIWFRRHLRPFHRSYLCVTGHRDARAKCKKKKIISSHCRRECATRGDKCLLPGRIIRIRIILLIVLFAWNGYVPNSTMSRPFCRPLLSRIFGQIDEYTNRRRRWRNWKRIKTKKALLRRYGRCSAVVVVAAVAHCGPCPQDAAAIFVVEILEHPERQKRLK